jgi:hypothetical protein
MREHYLEEVLKDDPERYRWMEFTTKMAVLHPDPSSRSTYIQCLVDGFSLNSCHLCRGYVSN